MVRTKYCIVTVDSRGEGTLFESDKRADVEERFRDLVDAIEEGPYDIEKSVPEYIDAHYIPLDQRVEIWIEERRSSRPKQEG